MTAGQFLSREECQALAARVFAFGNGGGTTRLNINSRWAGNLRWGRNDISTSGDTRQTRFDITRIVRGATGSSSINATTDDAIQLCVARAETLGKLRDERLDNYPDTPPPIHPHAQPALWFDKTVTLDAASRASVADRVIRPAESARLLSAGYLEVSGQGYAVLHSDGLVRYYPFSSAQCSISVRDVKGQGSGWAGVDWNDWARVDADRIATVALEKCLQSRNPVAVEPGRYTVILEPQAVCDLVAPLVDRVLDRQLAEQGRGPFADPTRPGYSRIGQQVVDPRITLSADPMDSDCGFVPFDWDGEPYLAVKWIESGVLKELAYSRDYALHQLDKDAALPNSNGFRLSGGAATLDEMIAGTTRGLLVTRFNNVQLLNLESMLSTGTTRDGLWLIEHGKISKAVKNFRFTESPIFALNNLEQLGIPLRVFRPDAPAVVPLLKVRDFSFTSLVDAF